VYRPCFAIMYQCSCCPSLLSSSSRNNRQSNDLGTLMDGCQCNVPTASSWAMSYIYLSFFTNHFLPSSKQTVCRVMSKDHDGSSLQKLKDWFHRHGHHSKASPSPRAVSPTPSSPAPAATPDVTGPVPLKSVSGMCFPPLVR
jgi:hypothetical protein